MPDTLQNIKIYKATSQPSQTQLTDPTDFTAPWTEFTPVGGIAAVPGSQSLADATGAPVWYKIKSLTGNGVVIPHAVPSLSGSMAGTWLWQTALGAPPPAGIVPTATITPISIATDPAGNIAVTGTALSPSTISIPAGVNLTMTQPQEVFVIVFNPDRTVKWSKRFFAPSNFLHVQKILYTRLNGTDGQRGIIITGQLSGGSVDFGSGTPLTGTNDVYVVRLLGSTGDQVSGQVYGTPNGYELPFGAALDANDNIYVTGILTGTSFNGVNYGGGQGLFLLRANASLALSWVTTFGLAGQNGNHWAFDVAVDSIGQPIIVGGFQLGINFKGRDGDSIDRIFSSTQHTFTVTPDPPAQPYQETDITQDIFIAKYGVTGICLWAKTYGGIGEEQAKSIVVDAADNAWVMGTYASPGLTFGAVTPKGIYGDLFLSTDIFLLKINSAGVEQYAELEGQENFADIPGGLALSGNDLYFLVKSGGGFFYLGSGYPEGISGYPTAGWRFGTTGGTFVIGRFNIATHDWAWARISDSSHAASVPKAIAVTAGTVIAYGFYYSHSPPGPNYLNVAPGPQPPLGVNFGTIAPNLTIDWYNQHGFLAEYQR